MDGYLVYVAADHRDLDGSGSGLQAFLVLDGIFHVRVAHVVVSELGGIFDFLGQSADILEPSNKGLNVGLEVGEISVVPVGVEIRYIGKSVFDLLFGKPGHLVLAEFDEPLVVVGCGVLDRLVDENDRIMVSCEELLDSLGVVLEIAVIGRDDAACMVGEKVVGKSQTDIVGLLVFMASVVAEREKRCRSGDGDNRDQQNG